MVAAPELSFLEGSTGARFAAAYRKWLGLGPEFPSRMVPARRLKRHKATADDIDLDTPVELVVIAPKSDAARCRLLGTERELTLRSGHSQWKRQSIRVESSSRNIPPPIIIDEVQYAPGLLRHVDADFDDHRHATGRFLITGSQDLSSLVDLEPNRRHGA